MGLIEWFLLGLYTFGMMGLAYEQTASKKGWGVGFGSDVMLAVSGISFFTGVVAGFFLIKWWLVLLLAFVVAVFAGTVLIGILKRNSQWVSALLSVVFLALVVIYWVNK